MAQDVIHPGVSSMCTWEKKWNLLSLDEISCRYWLGPSDPMYLSKLVFLKGLTALVGRSEVPKQQEEINCKWQIVLFFFYTKLKESCFNSVFPGSSADKESTSSAGDPGSIPESFCLLLMSMSEAFSVSFYTLIKPCYTKKLQVIKLHLWLWIRFLSFGGHESHVVHGS